MIKLLVLLFTFVCISAQETLFILPNHHSRFLHELDHSFKSASQILIISPSLHHAEFSKKILSVIKRGGQVTLIVQDTHGDPLSLIQYQNVELYLSSKKLHQTLIIVDDSLVCTGDTAINEDFYSSGHSLFRCSDDPTAIHRIRSALYPIVRNAKPYLK